MGNVAANAKNRSGFLEVFWKFSKKRLPNPHGYAVGSLAFAQPCGFAGRLEVLQRFWKFENFQNFQKTSKLPNRLFMRVRRSPKNFQKTSSRARA